MKMLILAAGQGTRLRPFTLEKPKCMVEFDKKPMLRHILDIAKLCNIEDIAIVTGYKEDVIKEYLSNDKITFYSNSDFETTNMVSTLFNASSFMDDDLIISYSDIIYNKNVLEKLILDQNDFSVVVDKNWKWLWDIRMENPLDDAETLKLDRNKIIEIGKKAENYDEIQGQYIGLVKISKRMLNKFMKYYESLDKVKEYEGKNFDNMYFTTLIQLIIDNLCDVTAIEIDGGWIEIDSVEDLKQYNKKIDIIKGVLT